VGTVTGYELDFRGVFGIQSVLYREPASPGGVIPGNCFLAVHLMASGTGAGYTPARMHHKSAAPCRRICHGRTMRLPPHLQRRALPVPSFWPVAWLLFRGESLLLPRLKGAGRLARAPFIANLAVYSGNRYTFRSRSPSAIIAARMARTSALAGL